MIEIMSLLLGREGMAEDGVCVDIYVDVRIHGDYEGLKNHMRVLRRGISDYQRIAIYFYQDGDVSQLYFPSEPISIDFWSQLLGIYYEMELHLQGHIWIPLDQASIRPNSHRLVFAHQGKACTPPPDDVVSSHRISLYQCYVAYHLREVRSRVDKNSLGGTFDQLHPGHKVLLSIGCVLSKKTLIIGLTMPSLLKNKKHAHHIQSFQDRKREVLAFVEQVYQGCEYDVVGLEDPYGPALTDPSVRLITVSYETRKGIDQLNQLRKDRAYAPLDVYQIPLLFNQVDGEDDGSFDVHKKISSSEIRARIKS